MSEPNLRALRRRQLDQTFKALPRDLLLRRPPRGWVRELREALGMGTTDLAGRLGISAPSVTQLEKDEINGSITLKRLERAAEALNSSLAYVLIPKRPLEEQVRLRGQEVAKRLLSHVDQTMALEAQSTRADERQRAIKDLADELIRRGRKLWRDQM